MTSTPALLQDRIKLALDHKGLSWSRAAILLGFSAQAATNWKKGKISNDTLSELAKLTGVNSGWLLDGQGPMLPDGIPIEENIVTPVLAWDNDTEMDDDDIAIPFYKDFLLACGSGATGEALKNETRRLWLSRSTLKSYGVDPASAAAMTAVGNSNYPEIKDKATVYVDLSDTKIVDGCVYAIEHDGAFKFKYLYNLPLGGLRVVSKNAEEYPEERLTAEQIKEQRFIVLGYAFDVQNPLPRKK
ncbi:XRE family transcriptional regulator [Aquirhabdus parva]|uniref:Helix-turn-helix transcriptional regulator n=1 Tax=Aquirhabdus parva TaxID=2283318 RepID=A0A345PAP6_9GAMM|nr:S24 family peptidase [Aquirhabdus parva]AXI04355.1 helix-turn-helix transcriptional regulator [Aquirhabdus parva]AXI04399.1 helix-turn-helix transcriptional regulator [Aquirhabdus parva]